jgi:hypothetical protein
MLHVAAILAIALLWEIADTLSYIKGECKRGVSKEEFSSDITEECVYHLCRHSDGTLETTAYRRIAGGATLADYIGDSATTSSAKGYAQKDYTNISGYTSKGHTNGSIVERGYDTKA